MTLRWYRLAAYGAPAFALAALTLPLYIYLPVFYAQNLGVGLAATGFVLMLARTVDMIADPVIGILSDRTRSRFGKRRVWIMLSLAPCLIATWFLLVPLEGAGAAYLFFWSTVLYIAWSAMTLPFNAWGAEMSDDHHARTRIAGWREGLTVAGVLAALTIAATIDSDTNPGAALRAIALMVVIVLPITVLIQMRFAPREIPTSTPTARASKIDFKSILRNKPGMRLLSAYLINALANGLPATLFLLFVQDVLEMPSQAGTLLFTYFLSGILSIPLWEWLSRRFGKSRTWCAAMLWACAFFLLVPLIGEGDFMFFLAVCILTGIGFGADIALPASMQADVVEVDTKITSQNRAGLYFALWGMVTKLALALAAGIAFPILEWTNGAALVALYALVPIGLKLMAIGLMSGYGRAVSNEGKA